MTRGPSHISRIFSVLSMTIDDFVNFLGFTSLLTSNQEKNKLPKGQSLSNRRTPRFCRP